MALEVETPRWQVYCAAGDPPADPRDEHCQSAVGRAADPWRAAQARHRYRTDERSQIYGQAKRPAISRVSFIIMPTASRLILGHGRRQILWVGVTTHPTAEWIANQITEACGWKQAPRYLIRDRDGAYGDAFVRRLRSMGIRDRPTSPRSPWQNGYAERLIGSIRRECVDHIVVLGERHLRQVLLSYMKYYNEMRTHLSLEKDAPVPRAIEVIGHILCRSVLGGLHHQYVRI